MTIQGTKASGGFLDPTREGYARGWSRCEQGEGQIVGKVTDR